MEGSVWRWTSMEEMNFTCVKNMAGGKTIHQIHPFSIGDSNMIFKMADS